jgi:hypothetical protein
MSLGQATVHVALDAGSVCGARPTRGLGARRLASFARAPLAEGALVPSPTDRNLARPDEVRDALAHVGRALDAFAGGVAFLLPDGVARIVLLDAPAHVRPEEYARYRLTPGLPFPARDAVVQAEAAGPGRILAAVAARPVVAEYEDVVRAAGFTQERMDLAPLAGLHALRAGWSRSSTDLDVVLGDAAYVLTAQHSGALRVLRSRRRDRDAGEPQRLALELARVLRQGGLPEAPSRVRVVGPGASDVVRDLAAAGRPAELGWTMQGQGLAIDAAEVPWLGGLFA